MRSFISHSCPPPTYNELGGRTYLRAEEGAVTQRRKKPSLPNALLHGSCSLKFLQWGPSPLDHSQAKNKWLRFVLSRTQGILGETFSRVGAGKRREGGQSRYHRRPAFSEARPRSGSSDLFPVGSDEAEGLRVLGHFLKHSLFAFQASTALNRRVQFSSHPSTTCSLSSVRARRLNDTALWPPTRSPT